MASGADAGRIPQARSPTCRSLPSIGGPALAICADSTMRTVSASGRIASATPRSRMIGATTSPRQLPAVAVLLAAPQPDARGVDRLLPERSESLALERRVAVADLAAGEERLQPVVGGARQDHAAQDLAPLVGVERGPDRRAAQEAVAGVANLLDRLRNALAGGTPGVVSPSPPAGAARGADERRGAGTAQASIAERRAADRGPRTRAADRGDDRAPRSPRRPQTDSARGRTRRSRAARRAFRHAGAATAVTPAFAPCSRLPDERLDLGRRPRAARPRDFLPPANTAIVGIERMRKRSPSSGTASVLTLTTR